MHTIQLNRNPHGAGAADQAHVRYVSATSISAEAQVRSMVRPHVPNYTLRRLLVGIGVGVTVLLLVAASIGFLSGLGGSTAVAADSAAASASPSATVAETGDTLWSIAAEHRGQVGHDRYLQALIRKNGGADVRVGQVVWLP